MAREIWVSGELEAWELCYGGTLAQECMYRLYGILDGHGLVDEWFPGLLLLSLSCV